MRKVLELGRSRVSMVGHCLIWSRGCQTDYIEAKNVGCLQSSLSPFYSGSRFFFIKVFWSGHGTVTI